jgi:hypothetical protein
MSIVGCAKLLEADPSCRTHKDMREAAERAARDLRLQIQTLREHFEQTGERAWDAQAVKVQ